MSAMYTKEKTERQKNGEKNQKEHNVFSIFSLIIHLQLGVRSYQFCNIKRNVNSDAEFTFIHLTNGCISRACV